MLCLRRRWDITPSIRPNLQRAIAVSVLCAHSSAHPAGYVCLQLQSVDSGLDFRVRSPSEAENTASLGRGKCSVLRATYRPSSRKAAPDGWRVGWGALSEAIRHRASCDTGSLLGPLSRNQTYQEVLSGNPITIS